MTTPNTTSPTHNEVETKSKKRKQVTTSGASCSPNKHSFHQPPPSGSAGRDPILADPKQAIRIGA